MRFTVDEFSITAAAVGARDASLLLANTGLSDVPAAVVAALPGSRASHEIAAGLTDLHNGLRSLVRELTGHSAMLRCGAYTYDETESTAAAALAPSQSSCDPAP